METKERDNCVNRDGRRNRIKDLTFRYVRWLTENMAIYLRKKTIRKEI